MSSHTLYDMKSIIPKRPKGAHKGMFGHVLVIGGDIGMPGAPLLAALGAAYMGAGLISVATRPAHVSAITTRLPEALCYGLALFSTNLFTKLLTQASVIILGPGLGQSLWSKWLFKKTIRHLKQYKTPCLIDADALNLIARQTCDITTLRAHTSCVFTPHPGEAARLLNTSIKAIQADRIHAVKALQKKLGGIVVLKGDETLVCSTDDTIYTCKAGNPAMASGGMGDLLSGVIAGLVTQGLSPFDAAKYGVYLHAKAGDEALHTMGGPGLLASDLLPQLKPLLNLNRTTRL